MHDRFGACVKLILEQSRRRLPTSVSRRAAGKIEPDAQENMPFCISFRQLLAVRDSSDAERRQKVTGHWFRKLDISARNPGARSVLSRTFITAMR